jgi:hypothetical protein
MMYRRDAASPTRLAPALPAHLFDSLAAQPRPRVTLVNVSPGRAWVRATLLAGVAYFVIGRAFSLPSDHRHAWRLAAWLVSAGVYATHIGYEHFRLRDSTYAMSWHVALAVAIGAIALAVAAMIHSLSAGSALGPVWLLALVIWPAVTAVPAFLGALLAGAALARLPRGAGAE